MSPQSFEVALGQVKIERRKRTNRRRNERRKKAEGKATGFSHLALPDTFWDCALVTELVSVNSCTVPAELERCKTATFCMLEKIKRRMDKKHPQQAKLIAKGKGVRQLAAESSPVAETKHAELAPTEKSSFGVGLEDSTIAISRPELGSVDDFTVTDLEVKVPAIHNKSNLDSRQMTQRPGDPIWKDPTLLTLLPGNERSGETAMIGARQRPPEEV